MIERQALTQQIQAALKRSRVVVLLAERVTTLPLATLATGDDLFFARSAP